MFFKVLSHKIEIRSQKLSHNLSDTTLEREIKIEIEIETGYRETER